VCISWKIKVFGLINIYVTVYYGTVLLLFLYEDVTLFPLLWNWLLIQ